MMSGLWYRLVSLTSTRPRLGAGCPGVWDEVAHGGSEGARTALKDSRVERAESSPGFIEPTRRV